MWELYLLTNSESSTIRIVFLVFTILFLDIDQMGFEPLQLKRRRHASDRFRMPEEDIASGIQGIVEVVDDRLSRRIVEIDQDVAAEYEIKAAHGPHRHAVLKVEMTNLDKFGGPAPHHPLLSCLIQVLLPVFIGNFVHGPVPVGGGYDLSQHVLVNIGGHDRAVPGLSLWEDILNDHRQRVSFLTRGATGGPDPQGSLPAGLLGGQHFRKTMIGKRLQLVVFPKH